VSRLARIEVLVALLVIGYIAGLPAMLWALEDARTISRRVWAVVGRHRSQWEKQLYAAYAIGGWPALAYAFWWRRSRLRRELLRERAYERDRGIL
jgi:hypothetical protein